MSRLPRFILTLLVLLISASCASTPARTPREGEFESWPKPALRVLPVTPSAALRSRESGYVLTSHVVDQGGRVVSVEVLDASPPGLYERATRSAILKWKYETLETNESIHSNPIQGALIFCFPGDACDWALPEGIETMQFDPSGLGRKR